jgi:hypothetical protein
MVSTRYRLFRQVAGRGSFAEVELEVLADQPLEAVAATRDVDEAWIDTAKEGAIEGLALLAVTGKVVVTDLVTTYVDTTADAVRAAAAMAVARSLGRGSELRLEHHGVWRVLRSMSTRTTTRDLIPLQGGAIVVITTSSPLTAYDDDSNIEHRVVFEPSAGDPKTLRSPADLSACLLRVGDVDAIAREPYAWAWVLRFLGVDGRVVADDSLYGFLEEAPYALRLADEAPRVADGVLRFLVVGGGLDGPMFVQRVGFDIGTGYVERTPVTPER